MLSSASDLYTSIHELIISDYLKAQKSSIFFELLSEMEERQELAYPNIFMMVRPRGFGLSLCTEAINSVLERTQEFTATLNSSQNKGLSTLPRHHVLFFNLKKVVSHTPHEFKEQLLKIIQQLYWEHHLNGAITSYTTPRSYFAELIARLSERHHEKIVILIDNYDIPLIMASMMPPNFREESVALYLEMLNVLRHSGAYLKYAFLSGHIKFRLASELSEGLPLVQDLSSSEKYDTLFGFTEDETTLLFKDRLSKLTDAHDASSENLLEIIKKIYGGFCFSDRLIPMICPMCINHVLSNHLKLLPYSATGDYAFLRQALKRSNNDLEWLYEKDGQDPLFGNAISLTPDGKELGSLLIQLGFATRDRVSEHDSEGFSTWRYRFVCTNEDMRRTLEILQGKKAEDYALEEIASSITPAEITETPKI